MTPEEYVQFETAKLLKEAGFPQEDDNGCCATISYFAENGDFLFDSFDFSESAGDISAPTQAVAMRWLREQRLISVEITTDDNIDDWQIDVFDWRLGVVKPVQASPDWGFNTYEAAAEAGIQAACKYLIEKVK